MSLSTRQIVHAALFGALAGIIGSWVAAKLGG